MIAGPAFWLEPTARPAWALLFLLGLGFWWARQTVSLDRERLVIRRYRFGVLPVEKTVYGLDCFEELGIRRHTRRAERRDMVSFLLEALGDADILMGEFPELEPAQTRAVELSALSGLPVRERVDETLEVETRGPSTT